MRSKIVILLVLLVASFTVSAQPIPTNKEMVRQQMNSGQARVRQELIRNERIMDMQEAVRYGTPQGDPRFYDHGADRRYLR